MAKVKFNSVLNQLSGELDQWIFRQTIYGPRVSPKGERRRPWSQAQANQRERLKAAGRFYRAEMRDPLKNARYRARAKEAKIPVSAFVMGGFLKFGTRFADLENPASATGAELAGRDGGEAD